MDFAIKLREAIADKHLLNHPFYQAWTAGELTQDTLREWQIIYQSVIPAQAGIHQNEKHRFLFLIVEMPFFYN